MSKSNAACRRAFVSYCSSKHAACLKNLNRHSENIDRLLAIVQSINLISYSLARMSGSDPNTCSRIDQSLSTARLVLSSTRVIHSLVDVFSGTLFFEVKEANGRQTVARRGVLDIVQDSAFHISRFLSPIYFLASVDALNLGKHSERIGYVSLIFLGIGFGLSTRHPTRDMFHALKTHSPDLSYRVNEAAISWLDVLGSIGECLRSEKTHPAIAIVGCCLIIPASAAHLFREAYYYKD